MELASERLIYQKFMPADLPDYLILATDESVMRYITGKALTGAEAKTRFEGYLRLNELHSEAGFFSVKTTTGTFIGLAKFAYTALNQVEVGYSLRPEFWGQHYASELVSCLLTYATTLPQVTQLIAFIDPANAVSARVLTNHRFVRVEENPDTATLRYQLDRPFCRQ